MVERFAHLLVSHKISLPVLGGLDLVLNPLRLVEGNGTYPSQQSKPTNVERLKHPAYRCGGRVPLQKRPTKDGDTPIYLVASLDFNLLKVETVRFRSDLPKVKMPLCRGVSPATNWVTQKLKGGTYIPLLVLTAARPRLAALVVSSTILKRRWCHGLIDVCFGAFWADVRTSLPTNGFSINQTTRG